MLIIFDVHLKLDIEGLHITVTSGPSQNSSNAGARKAAKGKARSEGTEILNNATLRLKPGQRYALVGRNGSGKSSTLARPLVPCEGE
jgi:ABC-type polysaccharide/polyol phosphate transport system ATPase subunit